MIVSTPGGSSLDDDRRERARDLFQDHVRGRGTLPSLRVANQPYGILATSILVCLLVFALSRRGLRIRAAIAALSFVFFFFTRVWSPQYWLWVLAALALAGAPGWVAAAASGAAVLDYVAAFGLLHLSVAGDFAQANWFYRELFLPNVAIRCAVIGGSAAWALRRALPSQAEGPRV